jgi:S-formylglutathione hydrolase FrmB
MPSSVKLDLCLLTLALALLAACQQQPKQPNALPPAEPLKALSLTDTLDGTAVHIERPANWTGSCLLALPGWNLPAADWKTKTPLVEMANKLGVAVVMPEVGKSIYARSYYPETRADWRSERLLSWMSDTLLNWLKTEYGLFATGQPHAVIGLSTGGRGAVLVAAARPELFKLCGALSGDFVPEDMPGDHLMRGWYGSLEHFPERWRGSEHPVGVIEQLSCRLYVAHGQADHVVPVAQSRAFLLRLSEKQPNLEVVSWLPATAGHDYDFWAAGAVRFLELGNKGHLP